MESSAWNPSDELAERTTRFYVSFPLDLAASIGLEAGETVQRELLNGANCTRLFAYFAFLHFLRLFKRVKPIRAQLRSEPKGTVGQIWGQHLHVRGLLIVQKWGVRGSDDRSRTQYRGSPGKTFRCERRKFGGNQMDRICSAWKGTPMVAARPIWVNSWVVLSSRMAKSTHRRQILGRQVTCSKLRIPSKPPRRPDVPRPSTLLPKRPQRDNRPCGVSQQTGN